MSKPNIVYFIADQMRSDSLGHLGNPASLTPNFDRLAQREAVSFANAYCQNPVCVPSRNSFLSGLYPHTTGHRTMHFLQGPEDPNILKEMKNQGYEVIWIGRNDVIPAGKSKVAYCDEFYDGFDFINKVDGSEKGFSALASHSGHSPVDPGPQLYSFYAGKADGELNSMVKLDWNALQSALDYLDRKASSSDKRPFFLYITLWFPHPPYVCEDPWYSAINRSKLLPRQ